MVFDMSFIYNNAIKYSDSPNLDAFGRLRVSNITSLIELTHVYNKQPILVNEVTAGTATSVWNQSNAEVAMGVTTTGDYVIRQTKQSAVYQPGKGQLFEASFSDFNLQSNVLKRVGYFTSTTASTYNTVFDGFFLESDGVSNQISFQIWKSGASIYSAITSSWDNSQIDITTVDWSKTNLMLVDFQWLGVGRLRFGLSLSGNTYIFADSSGTNNLNDVYMSSPNKPIRYEIRSSSGAGTFNQICSQVSMEGSLNSLFIPVAVANPSVVTLSLSGTKYPVMGFKMSTGYETISLIMRYLNILNTSNDNYIATVEINPTISGAYTHSTLTNTGVEYSFGNGSQTVTSQGFIIGNFIGEAGTQALTTFTFDDSKINPGRNINGTLDELWVCITPLGANATFYISSNLYYYS